MIKLRDLVARVRLLFDKDAAGETEKQAGGMFDRVAGSAKKLGVAMAAAFAVDKLKDWAVAAVKAANEADAIWNRLGGTLDRAGYSMAVVGKEIEAAAKAMQETTLIGDEEFAETLNELITISGDYEASLKNVSVVADFASAKQIDLKTASQLVGKAMIGETSTLKRYGVVVAEGADAVDQLRRQFAGAAENEAATFGGKMTQLQNTMGDFMEELGGGLVDLLDKVGVIDILNSGIERATSLIRWLRREEEETEEYDPHGAGDRDTIRRLRAQERARERQAREAEEARLRQEAGVKAAEARARAEAEAYDKAWADAYARGASSFSSGVIGEGFQVETPTGIVLRELNEIPTAVEHAAGAFQSMFGLITIDAETAQESLTQLGVALVTGGTAGISRFASMRSKMAAAEAVDHIAEGLAALANPAKAALLGINPAMSFKAAAERGAAAALWAGLAKGAGGGGGSRSGGGGYASSTRNITGEPASRTQLNSSITVMIDPLDPYNPVYQRHHLATGALAKENFGAMKVTVQPRTGR